MVVVGAGDSVLGEQRCRRRLRQAEVGGAWQGRARLGKGWLSLRGGGWLSC
jgi:hypothetical protein